MADFGFDQADVYAAINRLNARDFHKSADHNTLKGIRVDTYKKRGLHLNEDIYTHFHVRNGKLVIASFKELK